MPLLAFSREVDGVLIEERRLTAGLLGRAVGGAGRFGRSGLGLFLRLRHDGGEILTEGFGGNLAEFLADVVYQAGEIFHRHQGQNAVAGADGIAAEFERADGPRLAEHAEHRLADGRVAGAARFESIQAAGEFGRQTGFIDLEMPRDKREIGAAGIQQLHEEVFYFHVVVSSRKAQASRSLECISGCWIEFADNGTQVRCHILSRSK